MEQRYIQLIKTKDTARTSDMADQTTVGTSGTIETRRAGGGKDGYDTHKEVIVFTDFLQSISQNFVYSSILRLLLATFI